MISVIIPSALRKSPSGELWLERALRSVRAQTLQPQEILIGFDPGVDLPDIPSRADTPPLHFVSGQQSGHQAASNAAVAQAKGELIAFLEDDDLWGPEHLEVMLGVMQGAGADFVSCSQEAVTLAGESLGAFHFPTASSWLLKKTLWDRIGGFDTSFRIHHDNRFLNQINAIRARRIHFVPEKCDLDHPWIFNLCQFTPLFRCERLARFSVKRTMHPESIMAGCDQDAAKARLSQEEYARLEAMHGRIGW